MIDDIPEKDKLIYREPDASGIFSAQFFAFSTLITLKGYGSSLEDLPDKKDYRTIVEGVVDLCRKFEWLLSRTLKNSEITRINTSNGDVVEVSQETWKALGQGLYYSSQSKGHFDVTMGSVTQLWNFNEGIVPSKAAIDEALEHVDWRNVELFGSGGKDPHYFVRLKDADMVIDLGGTAKGFIADRLCEYLKGEQVAGAFVNLGGNVAVFGGKPDGSQWRIGIQSPFESNQIRGVMSLADGSTVTSGLYERCFTVEGISYHHILDRKTGFPVETDIAGVSVVANTSSDADGYSTTLFALGSRDAIRFVDSTPGIETILITKEGETMVSKGLEGFKTLPS